MPDVYKSLLELGYIIPCTYELYFRCSDEDDLILHILFTKKSQKYGNFHVNPQNNITLFGFWRPQYQLFHAFYGGFFHGGAISDWVSAYTKIEQAGGGYSVRERRSS